MDVPSPAAGVVESVLVKAGDRVSKGSADRHARVDARSRPGRDCAARGAARRGALRRRAVPGYGAREADGGRAQYRAGAGAASQPDRRRRRPEFRARIRTTSTSLVLGAGPGRLYGRLPRRGSRPQGRARRALADARRRVPQRGLHSVEGPAARGQGHRGGARRWRDHGIRFGEPQVDVARLREWKDQSSRASPAGSRRWPGSARSRWSAAPATFPSPHHLAVDDGEQRAARDRFQPSASSPRVRSRCACRGCPTTRASSIRRARSNSSLPKTHAGHRRRHHRPRDGDGLRRARGEGQRGRD